MKQSKATNYNTLELEFDTPRIDVAAHNCKVYSKYYIETHMELPEQPILLLKRLQLS